MLNSRWQFRNLHLLPSAEVFNDLAMGIPFTGVHPVPIPSEWTIPIREKQRFQLVQYSTNSFKSFKHSVTGRPTASFLFISGVYGQRLSASFQAYNGVLAWELTRFIFLKNLFYFLRESGIHIADNRDSLRSIFFHLSEISFPTFNPIERYSLMV